MSEYLDDEALLSIFFVNFLQINPSKINLLPPKPPVTKFHESCWRLNPLAQTEICTYLVDSLTSLLVDTKPYLYAGIESCPKCR